MNLVDEIQTLAELPTVLSSHFGPKVGLVVDGRPATYQEFETNATRVASALVRHGCEPDDRIAILSRDSLDSIFVLFGAAKAKCVVVNLNWRLTAGELAQILEDSHAKILFASSEFAPLAKELAKGAGRTPRRLVWLEKGSDSASLAVWSEAADQFPVNLKYDPEDIVVQVYTSGTTGSPKGVQLPNRSFFAIAQEMNRRGDPWIGWTERDVSLLFVPVFHIGGLWWLVRGLALGCTNVVLKGFEPATVLRSVERHRVTKMGMVPAMMQVLLREPTLPATDLSSLQTIVYGGSPISSDLLQRAMVAFPCDFCQIYGLTETGNMSVCLRPEQHRGGNPRLFQSAGCPLPGVELRILDQDRNPVEAGRIGEVAIHTPARMAGYWNHPSATRDVLIDGWILTGDAGYVDEGDFLYLCDRVKDMIIAAGENIYPLEIENVLRCHPGVADVAVIGVPDPLWGEAVKAIVVRDPAAPVSASELIRHTRGRLAEFKIPRSVEFVAELPRTPSGKVQKRKLREPYWRNHQRRIN